MSGALHSGSPTNDGSVIALARCGVRPCREWMVIKDRVTRTPKATRVWACRSPRWAASWSTNMASDSYAKTSGLLHSQRRCLAQPDQVALEVFDEVIESKLGNHRVSCCESGGQSDACRFDRRTRENGREVDAQLLGDSIKLSQLCAEGGASELAILWVVKNSLQKLGAPYLASWVTGSLGSHARRHRDRRTWTGSQGRRHADSARVARGGCAAGFQGSAAMVICQGNGLAQSFGLAWLVVGVL